MKLATIAFLGALMLAIVLCVASLFGYDPQAIGLLLGNLNSNVTSTLDRVEPVTPREAQRIAVPSGTFTGPTAQPVIKGPTAPPPNE